MIGWTSRPLTCCWRCMDRQAAYDSPAGLCDPCRDYLLDDAATDNGAWAETPEAAVTPLV